MSVKYRGLFNISKLQFVYFAQHKYGNSIKTKHTKSILIYSWWYNNLWIVMLQPFKFWKLTNTRRAIWGVVQLNFETHEWFYCAFRPHVSAHFLDLEKNEYTFGRGEMCDYQFNTPAMIKHPCFQAYSKIHFKLLKVINASVYERVLKLGYAVGKDIPWDIFVWHVKILRTNVQKGKCCTKSQTAVTKTEQLPCFNVYWSRRTDRLISPMEPKGPKH